jgi:hypothetical protein
MSGKAACVCHLEKIATSDPLIAGMLWFSRFSLGLARTVAPAGHRAVRCRVTEMMPECLIRTGTKGLAR